MKLVIKEGDYFEICVDAEDGDGKIIVDYGVTKKGVLSVSVDAPDRMGILYEVLYGVPPDGHDPGDVDTDEVLLMRMRESMRKRTNG